MPDREKVVKGLYEAVKAIEDHVPVRFIGYAEQACWDALALLKEQEAMLKKAYETLADMDFEFFCDDLMSDDGWCEERCKASGTQPECIERWLRKQISEGSVK